MNCFRYKTRFPSVVLCAYVLYCTADSPVFVRLHRFVCHQSKEVIGYCFRTERAICINPICVSPSFPLLLSTAVVDIPPSRIRCLSVVHLPFVLHPSVLVERRLVQMSPRVSADGPLPSHLLPVIRGRRHGWWFGCRRSPATAVRGAGRPAGRRPATRRGSGGGRRRRSPASVSASDVRITRA